MSDVDSKETKINEMNNNNYDVLLRILKQDISYKFVDNLQKYFNTNNININNNNEFKHKLLNDDYIINNIALKFDLNKKQTNYFRDLITYSNELINIDECLPRQV